MKRIIVLVGSMIIAELAAAQDNIAPFASSVNGDGWTVVAPVSGGGSCANGSYTGTCVVYVSASGDDRACRPVIPLGDPYTPPRGTIPCRTFHVASSLTRDSRPDWVLLRKGDTFVERVKTAPKGGQDCSRISLIGAYPLVPGPRPILSVSADFPSDGLLSSSGRGGGDYMAIVGLEFYNIVRDPSDSNPYYNLHPTRSGVGAIGFSAPLHCLLIEDNKFSYWSGAFGYVGSGGAHCAGSLVGGYLSFRRNVVVNQYSLASHGGGLFINCVTYVNIEENLFDQNGYSAALGIPIGVQISVGSPAIVTYPGSTNTTQAPTNGSAVKFTTTGALPTGLTNRNYFVCNKNGNQINLSTTANCKNLIETNSCMGTCESSMHSSHWITETIYNHDIYLQTEPTFYSWNNIGGNIIARGAATGCQCRNGGNIVDNVFVHNPAALLTAEYGTYAAFNTILDGSDNGIGPRGFGIVVAPAIAPQVFMNNIIANTRSSNRGRTAYSIDVGARTVQKTRPAYIFYGHNSGYDRANMTVAFSESWDPAIAPWQQYYIQNPDVPPGGGGSGGFNLSATPDGPLINVLPAAAGATPYMVMTNTVFTNNVVWNWCGVSCIVDGGSDGRGNVTSPNEINCTTCNRGGPYPDPTVSLGSYGATLGFDGTLDGFMSHAYLQSKDNWNPALMATRINGYIRAGFGQKP